MPHNVLVRDVGGGIYPRPVPENFLDFGAFPYTLSIPNFVRCILPSYVVSSTAARSSNVVTVTATAHGIPTGTIYAGYKIYYPGSPSLAAGWYDGITTVSSANTISFTAPGEDFASESVNGAAIYTSVTTIPGAITIPAGLFLSSSTGKILISNSALNTAATKTIRPVFGANGLPILSTTTFPCTAKEWAFSMHNATQLSGQMVDTAASSMSSLFTYNPLVDNDVTIQLSVSAASDFLAIIAPPKLTIYR